MAGIPPCETRSRVFESGGLFVALVEMTRAIGADENLGHRALGESPFVRLLRMAEMQDLERLIASE